MTGNDFFTLKEDIAFKILSSELKAIFSPIKAEELAKVLLPSIMKDMSTDKNILAEDINESLFNMLIKHFN